MKELVNVFELHELKSVREHLQVLLDNKHDVSIIPEPYVGICEYIAHSNCSKLMNYLDYFYLSWDKYTGRRHFPIPSPCPDLSEGEFYLEAEPDEMWVEGEYADNRYELVEHIVKCLDDLISNYDKYKEEVNEQQ